MRRIGILAILLIMLTALASPALAQTGSYVTLTVLVKDETGSAVAGATVMVFDSYGAKVAEATTNSTGYAKVEVPNATVTFWVELATGKYILNTVDVSTLNTSLVYALNASEMYPAFIKSNIENIEVTVVPVINSKVSTKVETNATVYAKETLNITFPEKMVLMPFVEARLVNVTVDGVTYDTNTVKVDLSSASKTITAHYEKYYTFTYTIETYIIVAFVILLFALFLVAIATRGARAIIPYRPRKYVRIG